MNEITRIHLAKIAYNIEPSAKKELGKYIDALQASLGDDEVMADIEIRMTELLRERSVKPEGTIDAKDVAAMKKQLGEPSDFIEEGSEASSAADVTKSTAQGRKLFRDPRGAWLGGVTSGLATLSGVPVWALRIIIALVALLSHGIILAVYLAFWLIIPRAKTPAEILQLQGESVTARSIQQIGTVPKGYDSYYLRFVRIFAACVSILLLLGAAVGTAVLAYRYNSPDNYYGFRSLRNTVGYDLSYWHWALGCLIATGVLVAAVFTTIAYMLFSGKVRRTSIVFGALAGFFAIATLGSGLGLVRMQENRYYKYQSQHTVVRSIALPTGAITALSSDAGNGRINYQVTNDTPKAQYVYSDLAGKANPPSFTLNNGLLEVHFKPTMSSSREQVDTVTIFGPALPSIEVQQGLVDYNSGGQTTMHVVVAPHAGLSLSGDIGEITGDVGPDGNLTSLPDMQRNPGNVLLTVGSNAQINLDSVAALSLNFPDSCGSKASVYISSLPDNQNTIVVNGKTVLAQDTETTCGSIMINARASI